MLQSTRAFCYAGALYFLVSMGSAIAATPASAENPLVVPFFAGCGLGIGDPNGGGQIAGLMTREGRSVAESKGSAEQLRQMPIRRFVPGLLVFGFELNAWPGSPLLGKFDQLAYFCPRGEEF